MFLPLDEQGACQPTETDLKGWKWAYLFFFKIGLGGKSQGLCI